VLYVPDGDWFGVDSFVYSVEDDDGGSCSSSVTVSVGDVNDFPIAQFTFEPNDPLTYESIYLNSTSYDPDGTLVNWSWDMDDGTVIYGEQVTYQFVDDGDYNVRLTVVDDDTYVDDISMLITVENRPPIAENDIEYCDEDSSIWIDVLTNDLDIDGTLDFYSLIVVSGPDHGNTNINSSTGEIKYSPDTDFYGNDVFYYTIMDNDGSVSNLATVNISIMDVNDPPIANFVFEPVTPKTYEIIFLNSSSFDTDGIIVNWSWDMDDGTVIYGEQVTYQYADDGDYNVMLTVIDNSGAVDSISQVVSVSNHAPFIIDDVDDCNEDTYTWTNVLDNDFDVDGTLDNTTLSVISGPDHGSISINTFLGKIMYVPNGDWFGVDSYMYQIADDDGAVGVAIVNVTVIDVNDPPIANFMFEPISPSTKDLIYMNSSSFDIDGTILNWTWDMDDGSIKYGEQIVYQYSSNGIFDLKLTVRDDDGSESSLIKQVSIGNLLPTAVDDYVSILEDTAKYINVSTNDYDSDGMLLLDSITVVDDPIFGSLLVLGNGSVEYVPNADFFGYDIFTYTIMDDDGAISNLATVNISVIAENDGPLAVDDYILVDEGGTTSLLRNGNDSVLDNDSDVDGDELSVIIASYPDHGSVFLNTDGTFTYTHDGSETSSDSFTYVANDGTINSNIATVYIMISSVNSPPIANDDSDSTLEDIAVITNVSDNDVDDDSSLNLSSIIIVVSPGHGTAVANDNGTVTYNPDLNFNDVDYYWYTIKDSAGQISNEAMVTITVIGVNDPPNPPINIHPTDDKTDVGLNPELKVQLSDPENDVMNISFYNAANDKLIGKKDNVSSGDNASIVWSNRDYYTVYKWYVIVNDSTSDTTSDIWTFTTLRNIPSGGGPDTSDYPPNSDASKSQKTGFIKETINFDGSASSDDGTIVNYSWDFGDGEIGYGVTITHAYSSIGSYLVELEVTDDGGQKDTDTITVVITKANNPPEEPIISGPSTGHKNVEYQFTISSSDEDDDTIQYIIDWGDGNATTTAFIENGSVTIQPYTWSEYGEYTISIKAFDGQTESGSVSYDVWIDVWPIDDVIEGHLVDKDSSEPYDVFDDTKSGKTLDIEMDNGTYLIDIDNDGKNEYAFDLEDGLTSYEDYVYQKYLTIFNKEMKTPGFEMVSFLAMLGIIVLFLSRRKRGKNI
jgi:PKD repeat protein